MPPTLASLVRHPSLKLEVRAGEDRLDTPVRWAHASELADPVPYMEGGELLLVTAAKLDAEDPAEMRRYVARLVAAGVAGLGFAAGVHYERTPRALVAAARAEGLPLLEVPRRTPFIAITKAVSAAIAAEQYQAVTAGFAAQRELTRAALAPEGPAALLGRLAVELRGWAALYDASGCLVAVAPSEAAPRAARLAAEAERLCDRAAPASVVAGPGAARAGDAAATGGEGERVELQSLGTGRRAGAVLAVGTPGPLGTAERYAVNSAVALLTLTTGRSRAVREAESRLAAAVLRMLLCGEPGHARTVAGQRYRELWDAPLRVAVAKVTPAPPDPAASPSTAAVPSSGSSSGSSSGASPTAAQALELLADAVETAAARAGEAVLVVPEGVRLTVLARDGGAALAACRRQVARGAARDDGGELVVGVSAPADEATVAAAHRQAEQALAVARRRGLAVVAHEEVATGSVLPLLADDAVRAFADGVLRALYEHDARGRGDLVASLRAWLARHGQWDAAAADLGVHRHTLRYRMRRVEEILGRPLDDPDVRMELWLALKVASRPERR
mgnify:CR=1 FL=1